jgi:hypothetical protein
MRDDTSEPLVAVICEVPLLAEAVVAALDGVADVHWFPAGRGDTKGLLRAIDPDAVVVDSDGEASRAMAFAAEKRAPLVHVSVDGQVLRTYTDGRWEEADEAASPESVRNAVIAAIWRRERVT